VKFDPASVAIFAQAPAADARGRPKNFDRERLIGVSDHLPITARIQVL
jgi:hypothetical protein